MSPGQGHGGTVTMSTDKTHIWVSSAPPPSPTLRSTDINPRPDLGRSSYGDKAGGFMARRRLNEICVSVCHPNNLRLSPLSVTGTKLTHQRHGPGCC